MESDASERVHRSGETLSLSTLSYSPCSAADPSVPGAVTLDKKLLRGPAADELTVEYALDSEDPANMLSVVWQVAGSVAGSAVIIRTGMHAANEPY